MRRRRSVPADPSQSTASAWAEMVDLIVDALPGIDDTELRRELDKAWPMTRYLIGTEATRREPCTLVAERLVCDFFTLHGADALEADRPTPPAGGATAVSWQLYLPVPEGAPFSHEDVADLGPRFGPGPAPVDASSPDAPSNAIVIDPDRLRSSSR